MEIEKKKIGIYLRVSTRERALFGYGLDSQKEKALQYLQLYDHKSQEIKFYTDDGVSAKDMSRPELQRLLKDVENGEIQMIVIYKLDRLARSVTDVYNIIAMLMDYKCNLVAVLDQLDIHSANGRMLVGILAIIAQWEREVIIERTRDGLLTMVHQGKYPYPRCPFGWSKDDDRKLHVDEKTSTILNTLGDMAIEGYSISDIVRVLQNEYGINRGAYAVKKWLLREINIGVFKYHGELFDKIVPAIMTEKKQKQIEVALAGRQSKWDNDKYYYANLVYCTCGSKTEHKVTNKREKKYYYYECPKCYKRINQTDIMKQTLNEIFFHADQTDINHLDAKLKNRLFSLNQKLKELLDNYQQDRIDIKMYVYSITKLKKEKKQTQARVDSVYINAKKQFLNKSDLVRKQFIQNYVARVIVDLDFKIVVQVKYKTMIK